MPAASRPIQQRTRSCGAMSAWQVYLEQAAQHLGANISVIVTAQEQAVLQVASKRALVDSEINKAIEFLEASRQETHNAIAAKLKNELDSLKEHMNCLEQVLAMLSDEISASSNLTADETTLLTKNTSVFITDIKCRYPELARKYLQPVIGSVTLKKTRQFEEMQESLKGFFFTVDSKRIWRGPIPRKEDAMVMLMTAFEKQGLCEGCFESGDTENSKQHTINRGAGVIDGIGPSAGGVLNGPTRVTLASTGTDTDTLFVSDTNNHRIQVYNSKTGQFQRIIVVPCCNETFDPHHLAHAMLDHCSMLFVSNSKYNRVYMIDVSHLDAVVGAVEASHTTGLAVMKCQVNNATVHRLYAAQSWVSNVLVFDVDTLQQVQVISEKGTEAGQIFAPHDLALLPSSLTGLLESRLFVCSSLSRHQIQVFDAISGAFMSCIAPGVMRHAMGMAISSSRDSRQHMLIVSDSDLHTLFLFDAITGASVRSIGLEQGSAIGQFDGPCGVAAIRDDDDHIVIYTAELGNNRVQIVIA